MASAIASVRPISRRAHVAFFRSFATLIGAGVAIRRSIEVCIAHSKDARLVETLESVASELENGASLSSAMRAHPNAFPQHFVAMIRAGELGGTLDHVLQRLAELLERDQMLRQRTGSALAYPVIVLISSVLVVMLLVANVVPTFAIMFSSMHVALPVTTRILIAIGIALQSPRTWLCAAVLMSTMGSAFYAARRVPVFAEWLDQKILGLPLYGALRRRIAAARFARTLGTLLHTGVALVPAISAACDTIESALYQREIRQAREAISSGESLASALSFTQLFDRLAMQLVHVGEESGKLDSMLIRIAEYHEIDVETTLATLGSILEPLLILILGGVVGTIVASILIPLYSIIGGIK